MHDLDKRQVGLRVLDGAMSVDTTTPSGKLIFGIFALLAEFERDLLAERTRAGLQAARARGRKGGRRSTVTRSKLQAARDLRAAGELTMAEISDTLGVSRSALYRALRQQPPSHHPPTSANSSER